MYTQAAIIIFIKAPILGQCKTRLAKDIGDEAALDLYNDFINYTISVTEELPLKKIVYIDTMHPITSEFIAKGYEIKLQKGKDIGERMLNAFEETFLTGARLVVTIGSDCPQLTKTDIEQAFAKLHHFDTVIGPANDGGYYLIGMKKLIPTLFKKVNWSTSEVLNTTISRLKNIKKSFYFLTEKADIDTINDLENLPDHFIRTNV